MKPNIHVQGQRKPSQSSIERRELDIGVVEKTDYSVVKVGPAIKLKCNNAKNLYVKRILYVLE